MRDFFEDVAEQTDEHHKWIVDESESVIINGRELKLVWHEEMDCFTYWCPEDYSEVTPAFKKFFAGEYHHYTFERKKDADYYFYEIITEDDDIVVVSWLRYDGEYGVGIPDQNEDEDGWIAWQCEADSPPDPEYYDIPFFVYEDGSAVLHTSDSTLTFDAGSFEYEKIY